MPKIPNGTPPPSGEQFEIGYGHHRVVVTEVGADTAGLQYVRIRRDRRIRCFGTLQQTVVDRCWLRGRTVSGTGVTPSRCPQPMPHSTNLRIAMRSMGSSAGCLGRFLDRPRTS